MRDHKTAIDRFVALAFIAFTLGAMFTVLNGCSTPKPVADPDYLSSEDHALYVQEGRDAAAAMLNELGNTFINKVTLRDVYSAGTNVGLSCTEPARGRVSCMRGFSRLQFFAGGPRAKARHLVRGAMVDYQPEGLVTQPYCRGAEEMADQDDRVTYTFYNTGCELKLGKTWRH